jgi:cytochrome c oxidase subunit 2
MRYVAALLLVALVAVGAWSFAVAPAHGWWMPKQVSSFGGDVDRLFGIIGWITAFFFVAVLGALAWIVVRGSAKRAGRASFVHGDARLEMAWTLVPFAILVTIAFLQLSTWNTIQAERAHNGAPLARVIAAQFDWRFQYPGRDGRFDTADDFEVPYDLVVPVNERVVLALQSRDVIHGFFVPAFRLKQDVVPGTVLTTWFEANQPGEYDLVCTQLCGFGHYRMSGKVRVVSRAGYDAWLEQRERDLESNGREAQR